MVKHIKHNSITNNKTVFKYSQMLFYS